MCTLYTSWDRCVAAGCSDVPDPSNSIGLHKLPEDNDSERKRRRLSRLYGRNVRMLFLLYTARKPNLAMLTMILAVQICAQPDSIAMLVKLDKYVRIIFPYLLHIAFIVELLLSYFLNRLFGVC